MVQRKTTKSLLSWLRQKHSHLLHFVVECFFHVRNNVQIHKFDRTRGPLTQRIIAKKITVTILASTPADNIVEFILSMRCSFVMCRFKSESSFKQDGFWFAVIVLAGKICTVVIICDNINISWGLQLHFLNDNILAGLLLAVI